MKFFALLFAAFTLSFAVQTDDFQSGSWSKKTFKIKGERRIEQAEDGTRILRLSEDFKTRNAPDLKLVLNPRLLSELQNKNAMEDAEVISLLSSNKGTQSYKIPASIDLTDYQSLLIHCEQYTKLWGGASL